MGDFAIGKIEKTCIWIVSVLIIGINVFLTQNFVTDANSPTPHTPLFYGFVMCLGILYIMFICRIVWEDILDLMVHVGVIDMDQRACLSNTKDKSAVTTDEESEGLSPAGDLGLDYIALDEEREASR
jgi:hypothetical protein